MTLVIELAGGPGSGKSTTAAGMFHALKERGVRTELVREYVKGWAWDGKQIKKFDQPYILAKQLKEESRLYGKVDVIVSDSPLWLAAYYAQKYAPGLELMPLVQSLYREAEKDGVRHLRYLVKRLKKYDPAGRYETEEQARAVDLEQAQFARIYGFDLGVATSADLVQAAAAGDFDVAR